MQRPDVGCCRNQDFVDNHEVAGFRLQGAQVFDVDFFLTEKSGKSADDVVSVSAVNADDKRFGFFRFYAGRSLSIIENLGCHGERGIV